MKLYINLDSLQLVTSPGMGAREEVEAKLNAEPETEIVFLREDKPTILDTDHQLKFTLKPTGEYDADPLVICETWTPPNPSDGNYNYKGYPSYKTENLRALFNINGDTSDDVASIICDGEIEGLRGGKKFITISFRVRVWNNVLREDDETPVPGFVNGLTRTALLDEDYTAADTARRLWLYATAGAGGHTIYLPATPVLGAMIMISDEGVDFSANAWTVDGNGKLIDGAAAKTLNTKWGVLSALYTGTFWKVF